LTIADEIRAKVRKETFENVTFEYVKGLFENGIDAKFIANAFELPIEKIEEYIERIESSSN
jgi:hypothetical protein